MISNREQLMQSILQSPRDDAPRLIFADWLEKNGEEELSQSIRVCVELARVMALIQSLQARSAEFTTFRSKCVQDWLDEHHIVDLHASNFHFVRGMVEQITLRFNQWEFYADLLLSAFPIRQVISTTNLPAAEKLNRWTDRGIEFRNHFYSQWALRSGIIS